MRSGHRIPDNIAAQAADSACDATLAELYAEPCTVLCPSAQCVPFVFSLPHSGRVYPPSFLARSRLTATGLRRSEDAFVDELFAGAALELGAPVIAARFPRAFLDVNRGAGELDPAMFHDALPLAVDAAGPRVQAGLGVIPRVVRDGADIYRGKLVAADAVERLERLYRPYHAALLSLMTATRARFGFAVVIDCHSMPSAAAVPGVILGDRYGVTASAALTQCAHQAFELRAFTVARNMPYAGGFTTQLYGRPSGGMHALQIEINRALYLDEERVVPSPRFADVRARVGEALAHLTAIAPDALAASAGRSLPWAAE